MATEATGTWAAESAYVTNFGGGVSEFDMGAGGVLVAKTPAALASASGLAGVAISADGEHVYVANFEADEVLQFDVTPTGALEAINPSAVPTASGPHAVAISPDDKSVYVTNYGGGVSQYTVGTGGRLAPKSPAIVETESNPQGIAVSPDGQSVYVTNYAGGVAQFNVVGGLLTPKVPASVAAGVNPQGIGMSPDGRSVYVTNYGGGVSQFSVGAGGDLTAKVPASVAAGADPESVAVSPTGRNAYVTSAGGGVSQYEIDTSGDLVPMTPTSVAAGTKPEGIAMSPSGKNVYVTDAAGGIWQFDVTTDGALTPNSATTVGAGANPAGIALLPDQAPQAVVTATPAAAGLPSTLDASGSTTSGGGPASYSWSFGDGSSAATTSSVTTHVYSKAGLYAATVTVRDDQECSSTLVFTGQTAYCDGTAAATRTVMFVVPNDSVMPVLTAVRESSNAWRETSTLARESARAPNRPPAGTTFSFVLNVPARVTLAFTKAVVGRTSGAKCVATTPSNRKARRCTRTASAGALTFSAHSGSNRIRFAGALTPRVRLKVGRHSVVMTAAASGRVSRAKTLSFTIVKG
jgi:DNA-binding beta-propeller fold protein YncE